MTTIEKQEKAGLQVCDLEDILFPVEKVEAETDANSDYAYDIFAYPKRTLTHTDPITKEVTFEQTEKALRVNSCSNRYALVPNVEIFPPILDVLKANSITSKNTFMHMNFARFYAEMVIQGHAFQIGTNPKDKIFPMLKTQHSYNGLTDYMISFGYWRLVCTNGLILPVPEMSIYNISITGKHTKAIHESLKKLDEAIKFFLSQGDKPMQNFQFLADRWVEKWEDRVIEVLEASKIAVVENKKFSTANYINDVIKKEADELNGGRVNEWLIYNGINRYVNDSDLNIASPKQRTDKEKAVMSFLLKEAGLN